VKKVSVYTILVFIITSFFACKKQEVVVEPICRLIQHTANTFSSTPEYLFNLTYDAQGKLIKRTYFQTIIGTPPNGYLYIPYTDSLIYSNNKLLRSYLKRNSYTIKECNYFYKNDDVLYRIRTYDNSTGSDYTHAIDDFYTVGDEGKPVQILSSRFAFIDAKRHPTLTGLPAKQDCTIFRRDTLVLIYQGYNLIKTVQRWRGKPWTDDKMFYVATTLYSDYDDKQNPYYGLPVEENGFSMYSKNNFTKFKQNTDMFLLTVSSTVRSGFSETSYNQQFSYDTKNRPIASSNHLYSAKHGFVYNCP
jgi:hypothetical protein